ncbi:hypothetical protein [methanotrophic endosymbiont of Bathymodiolus puteoserpentis (Logatchev)]|jgi:hypothetical protein|uniref:hypothetical protein n=1 Tax=methanotrophic endosymbiont of Bathymodiolus puteoserpentis (Logatchev) TaxID=343235 RepID=UPI0013CDBC86|nr:hypothetical protein [methanotrophic endosymbiont of Bathymodiolus puteoserpentis (Logatchev)]SHE23715.1 hypothetical protein BPUTEOMOX_1759 [methanotrophic endosymbiont of Bathymodiolus puteoserpentis (Logatchev)]
MTNIQKRFNDSVAEKADWQMLNTATASFNTRKLVIDNNDRIKYKMTWFFRGFLGLFIIVGLSGLFEHKAFVLFIFLGLVGFCFSSFPIVFDKKRNLFFRGRSSELFMDYVEINLSEIYALQLIGEWVSGSDGGAYNNYQINLINKESKRLHVACYASNKKAKEDALILKNFLGVKLWDLT